MAEQNHPQLEEDPLEEGEDLEGDLDPELEWELSEGIPQFADPFIQQYITGRTSLIAEEKKQRHDVTFKASMSPMAMEAARIMSIIRKRELRTVWTGAFEEEFAEKNGLDAAYPGMMFTLARDRMEKTELWKIIKKMPKGSVLHAHMDAMIDTDWLIDQAFVIEGFYISSPQTLDTPKALETAPFKFVYAPGTTVPEPDASIWTSTYSPNTLIPVSAAASAFPSSSKSGHPSFKAWAISRMTITPQESLHHHHGLDAIWRKFQSCFMVIDSLFYTEPVFRRCIPRLLSQLHSDGVSYIELRLSFFAPFYRTNSPTPDSDYIHMLQCFSEELTLFKASNPQFWDARILWTAIRAMPNQPLVANMKNCIASKRAHPSIISGFDLVAQEDKGRPLISLIPLLFWFRKTCAQQSLEIPFFFHAGECLGDGNLTDNNLFDAILLGTRRIGHGFSLYKHPLLISMVREKQILIESCPISHEVLRLTSSILSHPLPALLARGVPVCLNNDDPAILGHGSEANGLTHDFYQSFLAFENLGLEGLGAMAQNSVKWSAMEDQKQAEWARGIKMGKAGDGVKGERCRDWEASWEHWCEWVVQEYAVRAEGWEEEEEVPEWEVGPDDDDDGDDEDLQDEI